MDKWRLVEWLTLTLTLTQECGWRGSRGRNEHDEDGR
jgi:hypothetical protein